MELAFFNFAAGIWFVLVSRIILIGGGTGKFAPEAGKARMHTAFFTRVSPKALSLNPFPIPWQVLGGKLQRGIHEVKTPYNMPSR